MIKSNLIVHLYKRVHCSMYRYAHVQPFSKTIGKYQWLAGLIDGDGCFVISPNNYGSLEITGAVGDELMLNQVKQMFGGSLKARAGVKAIRYRLHHRAGLIQLIRSINGLLRNHIRIAQLKKILSLYQMSYCEPALFIWVSGYASGLFDSDGSIVLSVKQHSALFNLHGVSGKISRLQCAKSVQLSLQITQKFKANLSFLISPAPKLDPLQLKNEPFGNIYYDKNQNGYFIWTLSSRKHIHMWLHYNTLYPCYSKKRYRLHLITEFYELMDTKAYLASESTILKHRWNTFAQKWYAH